MYSIQTDMDFDDRCALASESEPRILFPKTTIKKTLIITVAIISAIGVGVIICRFAIKTKCTTSSENDSNTCLSAPCISEASSLINSMDLNVDPCTDFYSFVCGNWVKNNYLITSSVSQFSKLSRIILLRVKEILEDLKKADYLPAHKKKTNDFYKSCMDKAFRTQMSATELLSDLNKFGGWPIIAENWNSEDFNWANLTIQLFKSGYINNLFFTLNVGPDMMNTSVSLITVNQPSLGLYRRAYYGERYAKTIKLYKLMIYDLAMILNNTVINKEKSMADIEEAFKVEDTIVKFMEDIDSQHPESYYHIKTLEELEKSTPKIPWRRLLRNFLPSSKKLESEERFMVTNPSFIVGVNSLLEELDSTAGKRALANYMFYRVVLNAANFLTDEYHRLANGMFSDANVRSPISWEACADLTMTLFPLSLSASYATKYMNSRTKEELKMMFEDLRNSLMDNIRSANWLDDMTKKLALLKVRKIQTAIAYIDEIMDDENLNTYYEDVHITENHFGNMKSMIAFTLRHNFDGLHEAQSRIKWTDAKYLLTANAYYVYKENSIIIPVGVLQDTTFVSGRPNYINYGSLGMIVGHELNHAFDAIGSLLDEEGSYKNWWSKASRTKFEERMKCYERQYSDYSITVADSKFQIDGTLTLSENVADNGGVEVAYYAYKALLKRIGSEKSLPGLPYNEKQMFWISFASVWCLKETEANIKSAVKYNEHTPAQFRVIGTLSNMREFSEDFGCKLNSAMHPRSRCSLWD